MFTGIIESMGTVASIEKQGSNTHFTITSHLTPELKVDQSVSHNGVCLTVVGLIGNEAYRVTAIDETLKKTCLRNISVGDKLNLERCMIANGRFDGHIVQGHVDQVGTVRSIVDSDGSWLFTVYHERGDHFTVEKGSICVNGVSLTAFNASDTSFSVAIIPYTFEHTCFKHLKVGAPVNLEFDIIGKYVARLMQRG